MRDVRGERVAGERRDGETHALYADAVADGDTRELQPLGADGESRVDPAGFAGHEAAEVLNDASEHCRYAVRRRMRRSSPMRSCSMIRKRFACCKSANRGRSKSGRAWGPRSFGAIYKSSSSAIPHCT